jgi:hypothetical protein
MKNNKEKIVKLDISIKRICKAYLIVITSVPFGIYLVYHICGVSLHFPPSSATNVAMYFGTTIGGLVTLVAIFITIYKEKERREEENALQEEEKKRNARVFIVMDSYLKFPEFDDFLQYSHNADVCKLYYFHEWILDKDRELQWIIQSKNSNPTQQDIMASFIVANPTDRPIFDVSIKVEVDIVPTDNDKLIEGQSTPKEYEPINFPVLLQQSKIAFILPIIKKTQHLAKCVKITYITQMKEQMRYEYRYSRSNDFATEKYYASDKELFCFDKKLSPFYDLRRWDIGRRVL